MGKSVFPPSIAGRETYFGNVVDWVNSEFARLGIDNANKTKLLAAYGDDAHPDSYIACKKAYDAASKRKDTLITTKLETATQAMFTILRVIYNDIPASKWTDDDRNVTNRKDGLKHGHSVPENAITALCIAIVTAIANAYFRFAVRNKEDTKRCSLPTHATDIEVAFAVVESKFRKVTDADTGVLKSCEGPGKLTTNMTFPKARFIIQVDASYKGFDLVYWMRWTNASHPYLNGPWCGPFTEMIL